MALHGQRVKGPDAHQNSTSPQNNFPPFFYGGAQLHSAFFRGKGTGVVSIVVSAHVVMRCHFEHKGRRRGEDTFDLNSFFGDALPKKKKGGRIFLRFLLHLFDVAVLHTHTQKKKKVITLFVFNFFVHFAFWYRFFCNTQFFPSLYFFLSIGTSPLFFKQGKFEPKGGQSNMRED